MSSSAAFKVDQNLSDPNKHLPSFRMACSSSAGNAVRSAVPRTDDPSSHHMDGKQSVGVSGARNVPGNTVSATENSEAAA